MAAPATTWVAMTELDLGATALAGSPPGDLLEELEA